MKKAQLTKIEAARKAFQSYENAVTAAQEIIADGPVRGLGTTVMVKQPGYGVEAFKCSECGNAGASSSWKFCAFCSAEIIRFDRSIDPQSQTVFVRYK
jgi:hypothetical protein